MPKVYCDKKELLYLFECPACGCLHFFNDGWTFNKNFERPTVIPSIVVRGVQDLSDAEHARAMRGEIIETKPAVCHFFITDGAIEFLHDCTHHLKGQTVKMLDWTRS